jgi:hypothetical protein
MPANRTYSRRNPVRARCENDQKRWPTNAAVIDTMVARNLVATASTPTYA